LCTFFGCVLFFKKLDFGLCGNLCETMIDLVLFYEQGAM